MTRTAAIKVLPYGSSLLYEKASCHCIDLRTTLTFKSSRKQQKEGILKSYSKVANVLLETYTTDDIFTETDGES